MAIFIDGKALAQKHRHSTAEAVSALKKKGITPGLAFILVGEDPASKVYVHNKQKACDEVGIKSFLDRFSAAASEKDLLKKIGDLNQDPNIHGILVQLPLPSHLHTQKILEAIDPNKDVDGLHPQNLGRLFSQLPSLKPCTPQGIIHLIESAGIDIRGKEACVVGRSNIVGKPTALLLLEKNTTVTICHSQTQNLNEKTARADILVAAVGKPKFIRGEGIKKGSIVIDVGIHRLDNGTLVGDVDFEEASKRAAAISPVPGGVGPMTIAMLLKNTVEACEMSLRTPQG